MYITCLKYICLIFQRTVYIQAYKQAAQMLSQCRDSTQKSEQHTGMLYMYIPVHRYTYACMYFASFSNQAYSDFVQMDQVGQKRFRNKISYTHIYKIIKIILYEPLQHLRLFMQ